MREYELLCVSGEEEGSDVTEDFRLLLRRALLAELRERGVLTEEETALCTERLCRGADSLFPAVEENP